MQLDFATGNRLTLLNLDECSLKVSAEGMINYVRIGMLGKCFKFQAGRPGDHCTCITDFFRIMLNLPPFPA